MSDMTTIYGLDANGNLVEHQIILATPDQIAAAQARRPKPPIPGAVFLKRLQPAEYAAIITGAQTKLAEGDPQLAMWLDELRLNGEINVQSTDAQAAKTAIVAAGLLTQMRADEVFVP